MKIFVLTDFYPPFAGGGADYVAYQLSAEYARLGHKVVVVTTVREKKFAGKASENNISIYRIFTSLPMKLRAYWSIYNPRVVKELKKIIKIEKPDVAHAHNVHSALSYCSLKVIKKSKIPIILSIHDVMPFCYKKYTCYYNPDDLSKVPKFFYKKKTLKCLSCQKFRYFPLRNFFINYYLKFPDIILAVSKAHYELLKSNNIPVSGYVYNGMAVDNGLKPAYGNQFIKKFNIDGKKIILMVGRQHSAKGGKYLLDAVSIAVKKTPNICLLLLSKKEGYTNFLLNYAEKLGLEKNIIVTGWLDKADLNAAYDQCDLVVYPSVCFDTFGLVNLEAMAHKKPVIATCFGGVPEVVKDNETGFIINPLNTKNFAEKIIEILTDSHKAKTFGENGYHRLNNLFLINYQVNHFLEYMNKLVKGE